MSNWIPGGAQQQQTRPIAHAARFNELIDQLKLEFNAQVDRGDGAEASCTYY
jgi:hypothetical protein